MKRKWNLSILSSILVSSKFSPVIQLEYHYPTRLKFKTENYIKEKKERKKKDGIKRLRHT
jgi:hypothetical protein